MNAGYASHVFSHSENFQDSEIIPKLTANLFPFVPIVVYDNRSRTENHSRIANLELDPMQPDECKRKRNVTEKMRLANQLNSLKSTGPRTQAGKEMASKNALTHGMRAKLT